MQVVVVSAFVVEHAWQTQLIFYNSYGIFYLGVWGSCEFFRGDGGAFGVAGKGNLLFYAMWSLGEFIVVYGDIYK